MVSEVRGADAAADLARTAGQTSQTAVEREQKAANDTEQNQAERAAPERRESVSVSSGATENPQAQRVEQSDQITQSQLNGVEPKTVAREADAGAIKQAELASQSAQNQIQEQSEVALKAQANQSPEVVLDLLS